MRISFLFLLLNALFFTQILSAADDAQLKSALLKAIDAHDTAKVQALADGGYESIDRDDALQEKIYIYFEDEKERARLAKDQAKTDAVAKKAADEKMKADAAAKKAADEKAKAAAAAKRKAQEKANAEAAAAKKAADQKAAAAKKAADEKAKAAAAAKAKPAASTAAVSAAAVSAAAAKKAADEKAKADAAAAKKAADKKAADALAAKKAAQKKKAEEMLAAKKAEEQKAADALAAKKAAEEKKRVEAAAAKEKAEAEAKAAAEAAAPVAAAPVVAAAVVAVPAAAAVEAKESFNRPLTISDKKLLGVWKQISSDKVNTLAVNNDGSFALEEVEDDGTLTLTGTWRSDKNIFMLSIKKVQRNIHSRETNIHRIYKVEELSNHRLVLSDKRDRIAYDLKR